MDEKNKRQQIIIKICCLIAAFSSWLYITSVLNPIKTYKKDIPVIIENEDVLKRSNLVLVSDKDLHVNLLLKGPINDIYSVKESQFKLVLDLQSYILKKGENNVPVKLEKVPKNIKVINEENLWVKIVVDELIDKNIPLSVKTKGKIGEGYYALPYSSNIKQVAIRGASQHMSSIAKVEAEVDLNNAKKDIDVSVPIKAFDTNGNEVKSALLDPGMARIKIPVRKINTVGINVKFEPDTNRGIKEIKSIPDKVKIIGDEDAINNISSIDTETININNLNNGDEVEAKLILPKNTSLTKDQSTSIKVKVYFNGEEGNNEKNKQISIPIKPINFDGNNYNIKLEQDKVILNLSGDVDNLNLDNIKCYADLASLKEGEHSVPIKIELPNGVKLVSKSQENVKVEIKANEILEGENANQNK
ncbi:CdaR family protein [Clostridium tetani]|uniref:Membrane associated protein n=1 Tax=Clostridium tetani TaxID=1513 RepID=A0ABY0ES21_CLOTA|nr:CdaR family protein [Clostridium tetani]KHO32274.1 hypothetical protein OR62_13275 [Clostridium tetani]RXI57731.1 hypothetical protein DP131_03640 [Clostridium tetani]RXI67659.1 hypothetical protein DQN76_10710 [Clostridium tetani]CDI50758.1 membrane associated protein [Clostridium tetani 12124569]